MRIAVVSTSLSPTSRSHALARLAEASLKELGDETDFLDLREWDLPLCGKPGCYDAPHAKEAARRLGACAAVLMAAPVYNYDVNAAAKNLVELSGVDAWGGKPVGLLLSAGGQASYMAAMGLANSLMLDFRCLVVPRFVYALGKQHVQDGRVTDPEVARRVQELAREISRLTRALAA